MLGMPEIKGPFKWKLIPPPPPKKGKRHNEKARYWK